MPTFFETDAELSVIERTELSKLRQRLLVQIATLLAKTDPRDLPLRDAKGDKVDGPEIFQDLASHKAMALYKYYLPLIDEALREGNNYNRDKRIQFVAKVNHAARLAKVNFPFARAGALGISETKSIMDDLDKLVSAQDMIFPERYDPSVARKHKPLEDHELGKGGQPLYRSGTHLDELYNNSPFVIELVRLAENQHIQLTKNNGDFRNAYEKATKPRVGVAAAPAATAAAKAGDPTAPEAKKDKTTAQQIAQHGTAVYAAAQTPPQRLLSEMKIHLTQLREQKSSLANDFASAVGTLSKWADRDDLKANDIKTARDDISRTTAYILAHNKRIEGNGLTLLKRFSQFGDEALTQKYLAAYRRGQDDIQFGDQSQWQAVNLGKAPRPRQR